MGRIDRVVLWVIVGISFAAVGAAALVYANDWWLSGLVTGSIFCWLTGVLAAIYIRPERRPVLVGAVVASLLYVVLALGPWFRVQVGPWLLSTQALVHVETRWLGRAASPPPAAQIVTTYPVLLDSGWNDSNSFILTGPTPAWTPVPATVSSRFVEIGHWLSGWIAAALGAVAAGWISRPQKIVKVLAGEQSSPPIAPTNGRGFGTQPPPAAPELPQETP